MVIKAFASDMTENVGLPLKDTPWVRESRMKLQSCRFQVIEALKTAA